MSSKGFTLVELMIVVVIIAILAAIAYPSYREQVYKSRRSDAQAALLNTAQVLERCYTEYNAYNNASCPVIDSGGSGLSSAYTSTENGYYTLSTTTLSATAFTLQATPQGAQADDKCGKLTYDHVGRKGIQDAATGVTTGDCW
jgi:type IV pilus assembly protein PilE